MSNNALFGPNPGAPANKPVIGKAYPSGSMRTLSALFVEDGVSTQHQALFPIPAGAVIEQIGITLVKNWVSSATLDIGDTADPDGYITNGALDYGVVGQGDRDVATYRVADYDSFGSEGVYVDSVGDRLIGPFTNNFGFYYAAGSNIIATVNVGTPSASDGRLLVTVTYFMGETITPTASV